LKNSWPDSRHIGTQLSSPLSSPPPATDKGFAGPVRGLVAALVSLTLTALLHAQSGHGVDKAAPQAAKTRVLSVARDIIAAARFATFVTLGDEGTPQARVVDPLSPDADFVVYVATNPLSRKVREIRKDSRVTLLYFDPGRPGYVTLVGRAREVTGPEKQAHHKNEWQAFFPAESPASYALYRVVPSRVEVVSAKDGLPGDSSTWRPEIVVLK
jgi:general stress protein 26